VPLGWSPNEVAAAVLRKSGCAVLALTSPIELFTQFHYRKSIREDADLSELFRDNFLFHWKEKSQHAILFVCSSPGSRRKIAGSGFARVGVS
jgi:hypothetical protein